MEKKQNANCDKFSSSKLKPSVGQVCFIDISPTIITNIFKLNILKTENMNLTVKPLCN